jgi:hypothetical protein
MAKAVGTQSEVTIDGNPLENITNIDFSHSCDMAESTDNDDSGSKTFLPADAEASLTITCKYDPAGAEQTILRAAVASKSTVAVVYTPIATTLTLGFSAYVSELSIPSQHGDVIETTFTFRSTGDVTHTP